MQRLYGLLILALLFLGACKKKDDIQNNQENIVPNLVEDASWKHVAYSERLIGSYQKGQVGILTIHPKKSKYFAGQVIGEVHNGKLTFATDIRRQDAVTVWSTYNWYSVQGDKVDRANSFTQEQSACLNPNASFKQSVDRIPLGTVKDEYHWDVSIKFDEGARSIVLQNGQVHLWADSWVMYFHNGKYNRTLWQLFEKESNSLITLRPYNYLTQAYPLGNNRVVIGAYGDIQTSLQAYPFEERFPFGIGIKNLDNTDPDFEQFLKAPASLQYPNLLQPYGVDLYAKYIETYPLATANEDIVCLVVEHDDVRKYPIRYHFLHAKSTDTSLVSTKTIDLNTNVQVLYDQVGYEVLAFFEQDGEFYFVYEVQDLFNTNTSTKLIAYKFDGQGTANLIGEVVIDGYDYKPEQLSIAVTNGQLYVAYQEETSKMPVVRRWDANALVAIGPEPFTKSASKIDIVGGEGKLFAIIDNDVDPQFDKPCCPNGNALEVLEYKF